MAKGAKARAAARKQRDKWKAKRWYTIRAPRNPWSFRVIGETLAEEPEQLIGRTYDIMQNELDGDFSKMHVQVIFRITEALGGDALTEFIGHNVLKDHIRRQIRRHRGKVDDTVDVVTEDGYYVRFKPLLISRSRVKSSQKSAMRAMHVIQSYHGCKSTWIQLQKAVLDGTMEDAIKESVSKVSPVRTVMIRRSQLLQSGVIVEDGPTLDEIHAEEKAAAAAAEVEEVDVLAAAEASAELSEVDESNVSEDVESEAEGDDSGNNEDSIDIPETNDNPSQDYDSMTVAELKQLLKEAGKPVSGKKADLIARLQE